MTDAKDPRLLSEAPYESHKIAALPAHLRRIAQRDYCGVNEGYWALRDAADCIAAQTEIIADYRAVMDRLRADFDTVFAARDKARAEAFEAAAKIADLGAETHGYAASHSKATEDEYAEEQRGLEDRLKAIAAAIRALAEQEKRDGK